MFRKRHHYINRNPYDESAHFVKPPTFEFEVVETCALLEITPDLLKKYYTNLIHTHPKHFILNTCLKRVQRVLNRCLT